MSFGVVLNVFPVLDPLPQDGGEQEPDGSQLAVPDGTQVPGGGQ